MSSSALSAPVLPPFPPAAAPVRRFRGVRAVLALMLREMASSYGKSFGGYFWAIAEPALGIALLTFIFMLALRTPSLGHNFPIFYASAFLPFFTYVTLQRKISAALRFTKGLTNYPDVTFADAILARFILNLMTQIAVFYIVIAAIELSYETHTRHDYGQIILAMAMAAVLALGIGVLNCFLFFHIPMLDRFWIIVNRPLFLLSGVLYVYEEIPRAWQGVLWWNPVIHITGAARRGFYPGYEGDYITPLYVFGIGLGSLVAGLFLLVLFHSRRVA